MKAVVSGVYGTEYNGLVVYNGDLRVDVLEPSQERDVNALIPWTISSSALGTLPYTLADSTSQTPDR